MKNTTSLFLAVLSGGLLAVSFPPIPLFLLAFVAFVPLFFIFSNENIKHRFLLLYITFFIYHSGTNWWISSWQQQTDPYLFMSGIVLALAHPFFFMIPFGIMFYFRRKIGYSRSLWLFPLIWTVYEWLHSLGDFSYPWLTVGNTQILNLYWVQFADITGVWGVSFLIILTNVAIYKIIIEIKNNNSKFDIKLFKNNGQIQLNTIIIALIIILPILYSVDKNFEFDHDKLSTENESLTVSLIQPNINPWEKWEGSAYSQVRLQKRIQDSLSNNIENIDLSIWSETAIPFLNLNFNAFGEHRILQKWIDQNKFSVISGFSEFHFYNPGEEMQQPIKSLFINDSNRYYITYNAALLLNPYPYISQNPQIYRKSRLTPFAERFPYADQLSFAQEWIKWGVGISAWGKGQGAKSLSVINEEDTTKIGTIICIESVYPEFCTGFVSDGAEILSIITNDAWYNYTIGPRQHYLIAAMRAIENRRYIARCANSGVTGFISPIGKSLLEAPQYTTTGIVMAVPKITSMSFYTKFGDWLPVISLIIVILIFVLGIIKPKKLK